MEEGLTTRQLAKIFHVEPASIIRSYCINGHYMGLKPVKLKNRRLDWPSEKEVEKAIRTEAA